MFHTSPKKGQYILIVQELITLLKVPISITVHHSSFELMKSCLMAEKKIILHIFGKICLENADATEMV